MTKTFNALVVSEAADGSIVRGVHRRTIDELPAGAVLIRVHYSSLNYKDALSATGHRGITRRYPHTPGVDAAGVVEESASPAFRPGDEVICTGYDLGMNTAGGFGQYIRVPAEWVVPRPNSLSLRDSMIYGTAGFTAALAVYRLQYQGVKPEHGDVLVTGATGGVGSVAVAILAHAGYRVVAATGKPQEREFLTKLGAAEIIARAEVDDTSDRPLLAGRWAAAVDTVGGNILSTVLRSLKVRGVATCCGMVVSPELHASIFPFILRGATLIGLDSANTEASLRRTLWSKLASEWKIPWLNELAQECALEALSPQIDRILKGGQTGRVLVSLI
ncbi:MAG: YhdH/YhfP family quinone oxidoreductase [Gammaproteobacteria bacterium]|nr:YhdH/YhfP family quinone oxidoreductase [Gammaproteobacteria bacterium]